MQGDFFFFRHRKKKNQKEKVRKRPELRAQDVLGITSFFDQPATNYLNA